LDASVVKKYTDKALNLCIYASIFLTQLAFWLPENESFETPKTAVYFSLITLAAALFIIKQLLSGNIYLRWTSFSIPVAAIVVVSFLSLIKGVSMNVNALPMHWQFFKFILMNAVLYFLIINVFGKKDILKLFYFLFASHFIAVTYGVFQYFGVDFIKWVSFGEGRVYSTLGNPDYMAAQFSIIIPLMIVLIMSPLRRTIKFIMTLYLAFMFFLIIVSHGRGAWLGFLGSLAYMFIVFWSIYGRGFFMKYKAFTAGIIAFVLFLGVIFSFPNALNRNSQSLFSRLKSGLNLTSNSASVRLFYWESALQMAMHNPLLGVGIGGFSFNTAFYQKKVFDRWLKAAPDMAAQVEPHVELYTHNDFLQTLAEEGFLGLGVFIWLFVSMFLIALIKALKEEDPLYRNILLGLSGAVVAYVLNALLNFPWRVATTMVVIWCLFGIFSLAENKKTVSFAVKGPVKLYAAAVLAVALIFSSFQFDFMLSNSCIKEGQTSFAAGKYDEARAYFERGLSSNPRGTDIVELVLYAGNAYNALQNIDKAAEYYNRGLKMFPNFIEAHYNVGNVYMNNKMYDKALSEFNKVLDLNPKFSAAWNNMANVYFNQGQYEKARDMYTEALKLKPDGVEARFNLGATYFRLKQYKLAYQELSKTLEYDPNYELAKAWLGKMKELGLGK
jgi:pentatricopeptide repeat protein